MASALYSAAGPPSNYHRIQLSHKDTRISRHSRLPMQCSAPSKPIVPLCSPSSTAVAEEDGLSPSSDALPLPSESQEFPRSGCKACGREEIEKGCNGEGRIQGGIATVPGFGWWPIKAYRPCPGFVASGGRYRRQGQSMDEVVSGRAGDNRPSVPTVTPTATDTDQQPSKKKEGPRKFKR